MLILIGIVLVPVIAIVGLRINAVLVFLALCLGAVLTQYVAEDAGWVMTLASPKVPSAGSVTDSSIKLGLLLLPPVLTAIFMIRTIRGGRQLMNILPALGVGLLTALLAVPFLPPGTAHNVTSSALWHQVTNAQDAIVGASALLCLLVLWLQRPKSEGKHGKHHD